MTGVQTCALPISKEFDVPVVCQIGPDKYTKNIRGASYSFNNFTNHPEDYESAFLPYTRVTDIFIACHFWDPRSPYFFTKDDMKKPDFRISVVADISCDINGPIPSTLRASTIADPFYAYNPQLETEEKAFSQPANITVMAIDNLPGELPRDASMDFGKMLMNSVLHDILTQTESPMVEKATIINNGILMPRYSYLEDFIF